LKTLNEIENLSVQSISELSESKVRKIFQEARYHYSDYKPYCNECGSFKKWNIKNKENQIIRFKCKDCSNQYSITSDTIFNNHKYPLKTYLLGLFLFVNSVKGISSLQLSRDLNISGTMSYLLLHKIRTSLFNQYVELQKNKLKGTVQVDGAYVNFLPKKENKKKDRKDRRELKHQNQECIITLREVNDKKSDRSFAFIVKNENKEDIESLINRYVEPKSTIVTDEHTSYKGIKNISNITGEKLYYHKSVNHSQEYQNDEGINTNFAESYFSRFKRMVIGQHHSISKKYLGLYVNEITYRENVREWTNKEVLGNLLRHCLKCHNETIFNRYNQRKNSDIKHFRDFKG
jgi:transposase-like protein